MGEEESEQVSLSLLQQSPFRTENFYIIGENANTSPSTIPAFTPALRSGKCCAPKAPSVNEFQEQPEEEKLKILRSSGDTRRRRTYASCGPFNSKNPFLWLATPQPVFRFDFVCFAKIIFVFFVLRIMFATRWWKCVRIAGISNSRIIRVHVVNVVIGAFLCPSSFMN